MTIFALSRAALLGLAGAGLAVIVAVSAFVIPRHVARTTPAAPTEVAVASAPASPAPVPDAPASAERPQPDASASAVASAPAPQPVPDKPVIVPAFDIVRVEPSGEIVTAGTAAPGATVELIANGQRIDRAVADLNGQWAIVPKALTPGAYELTLTMKTPEGRRENGRRNVTVLVPETQQGRPLVTLNDPNQPTTVLQGAEPPPATRPADQPAAAAPAPLIAAQQASPNVRPRVAIVTAEPEDGGRFFASGTAAPGAVVRLYLNESYLATARTGDAGRWTFTVEKGLAAGKYTMRTDDVNPASGEVISRAEVAFEVLPRQVAAAPAAPPPAVAAPVAAAPPVALAPPAVIAPTAATPPPGASAPTVPVPEPALQVPIVQQTAPPSSAPVAVPQAPAVAAVGSGTPPQSADVVISDLRSAVVVRGDSLWRISRRVYGRGIRYTQIFQANTDQIRDPRRIYPGQVFVLPNETVN